MRRMAIQFMIAGLLVLALVLPAGAQPVTADDARSVAQNWVALTIRQQGGWGGFPTAQAGEIQEFRRGDRLIGYFCPVEPHGFIVVSLRRELTPVKAYSDTSDLDTGSEEGLADLIKVQMAATLDEIEARAGPIGSVSSAAVTPLMEFNCLGAWDVLDTVAPASDDRILAISMASNYQQGGVMLTTQWHQSEPFYNEVPSDPSECGDPHCPVGCVATAGAQLMAYWDWPPYGVGSPYDDADDWPRMANQYIWDGWDSRWEDENGNPLTQAHLDAVSELSREVGSAVGMDYCNGGCQSSAPTKDMEDVYEDIYRYSSAANKQDRDDYSGIAWFTMLKETFNLNRPVQYRIEDHSIVGDGWRESTVGGVTLREYHMNYGWGPGGNNVWYILDGLNLGGIDIEYVIKDIFPAQSLGNSLAGTYPLDYFPYRYFDRDTSGNSAAFSAGQYLQFLPGVKATCNSGTGTSIRIDGTNSAATQLFTRGDTTRGVHIHGGTLKLDRGGSIRLL